MFPLLLDEVENALHPQSAPATMGLSAACLGHDRHQSTMAQTARRFLTDIVRLHTRMTRAMTVPIVTPKTARYHPKPAVISFLTHCTSLERLTDSDLSARVTTLTSRAPDPLHASALDPLCVPRLGAFLGDLCQIRHIALYFIPVSIVYKTNSFGNNFPTFGNDFRTFGNNFPIFRNDFPTFRNDFTTFFYFLSMMHILYVIDHPN